jgi:hypothetical protein
MNAQGKPLQPAFHCFLFSFICLVCCYKKGRPTYETIYTTILVTVLFTQLCEQLLEVYPSNTSPQGSWFHCTAHSSSASTNWRQHTRLHFDYFHVALKICCSYQLLGKYFDEKSKSIYGNLWKQHEVKYLNSLVIFNFGNT